MGGFGWNTVMKNRNNIYGIVSVWIVIYHLYLVLPFHFPLVSSVVNMGNIGVDIFLVLSAIGLSFSVEKNNIKTFYYNRIKRILTPYILVVGIYLIWQYFISSNVTMLAVPKFLFELSTVSYFFTKEGNFAVWYVPCILFLYMIYPFCYNAYKKNKLYLLCLMVLVILLEIYLYETDSVIIANTERTFSRIPIFLFGILISDYIKLEKKITLPVFIFSLLLVMVITAIYIFTSLIKSLGVIYIRYAYGVMAVPLVILFSFCFEKMKAFKFSKIIADGIENIGKLSLEIYIVHVVINRVFIWYDIYKMISPLVFYVGLPIISIILSHYIRNFTKLFLKQEKLNHSTIVKGE